MTISNSEYWKEINAIAQSIAEEAMEQSEHDREEAEELINDSLLHETIDSHQWVIYCAYNLSVLQNSDNAEYMIDNFGSDQTGEILKQSGLRGLHSALAFWAMHADVQELINDKLDEIEDGLQKSEV